MKRLAQPKHLLPLGVLFLMQALLGAALLWPFLSGKLHFAYLDIGGDTYAVFVATARFIARAIGQAHLPAWTFEIGLGSPTAMLLNDVFSVLSALGGAENVEQLRIWVYALKISLAGAAFFAMLRPFVRRWESAVISALMVSFCGYMMSNGQFDTEANALIVFPLMAAAAHCTLRSHSWFALPLAVALALSCGLFFVLVAVSIFLGLLIATAVHPHPKEMAKQCLYVLAPRIVLGFLLAAPVWLPIALQTLDSPRAAGGQSLVSGLVSQAWGVNSWQILVWQLGGLFHKGIFGTGQSYFGYMNYLEGPEFYLGALPLVLMAQLVRGDTNDRRLLVVALVGIAAYLILPFFRLSAMAFGAPYFRATCVWVTLLIGILGGRAIDLVLAKGFDRELLSLGASWTLFLLTLVITNSSFTIQSHVETVVYLVVASGVLGGLALKGWVAAKHLPWALAALISVDAYLMVRPNFYRSRITVPSTQHPYEDGTAEALAYIRAIDPGWYRVEKSFNSVVESDALAQGHMGVRAYHYNSSSAVAFHVETALLPKSSKRQSYTNWLSNTGDRYMLSSLLGVKYFITKKPVTWPGYRLIHQTKAHLVYINDLALPLGVVQHHHISATDFSTLLAQPRSPTQPKHMAADLALLNTVVLGNHSTSQPLGMATAQTKPYTPKESPLAYQPAAFLAQASGFKVSAFSDQRITGSVRPIQAGILVFSIPYNTGWRLSINSQPAPLFIANFGMLATSVSPGEQQIELSFEMPGRTAGWFLSLLAIAIMGLFYGLGKRSISGERRLGQ